jgi:hypothetical protein
MRLRGTALGPFPSASAGQWGVITESVIECLEGRIGDVLTGGAPASPVGDAGCENTIIRPDPNRRADRTARPLVTV